MKKKAPIRSHILDGKKAIKEIMQENLASISQAMISQIMGRAKKLTPSTMLDAIKNIEQPGTNNYKQALQNALSMIASHALKQVRKEVPSAKNIKLNEYQYQLDEFDNLPPGVRKRIQAETQLLVGTQMGDLEKEILFQYTSSYDSTDSLDLVESDLLDSAESYVMGTAIDAGSTLISSEIINTARNAFFMDDDVKEELDALQFVNGDPVTDICSELAGTIFSADDPDAGRFQPPLHWNCKSYIVPILKGNLGSDEVEDLHSYKHLESQIQLSEESSRVVLLLSEMTNHTHRPKSC